MRNLFFYPNKTKLWQLKNIILFKAILIFFASTSPSFCMMGDMNIFKDYARKFLSTNSIYKSMWKPYSKVMFRQLSNVNIDSEESVTRALNDIAHSLKFDRAEKGLLNIVVGSENLFLISNRMYRDLFLERFKDMMSQVNKKGLIVLAPTMFYDTGHTLDGKRIFRNESIVAFSKGTYGNQEAQTHIVSKHSLSDLDMQSIDEGYERHGLRSEDIILEGSGSTSLTFKDPEDGKTHNVVVTICLDAKKGTEMLENRADILISPSAGFPGLEDTRYKDPIAEESSLICVSDSLLKPKYTFSESSPNEGTIEFVDISKIYEIRGLKTPELLKNYSIFKSMYIFARDKLVSNQTFLNWNEVIEIPNNIKSKNLVNGELIIKRAYDEDEKRREVERKREEEKRRLEEERIREEERRRLEDERRMEEEKRREEERRRLEEERRKQGGKDR